MTRLQRGIKQHIHHRNQHNTLQIPYNHATVSLMQLHDGFCRLQLGQCCVVDRRMNNHRSPNACQGVTLNRAGSFHSPQRTAPLTPCHFEYEPCPWCPPNCLSSLNLRSACCAAYPSLHYQQRAGMLPHADQ